MEGSEEVIGQMAMLFDEPEVYAHLEEMQLESVKAPEQKPAAEKKKRAFILDKLPENVEPYHLYRFKESIRMVAVENLIRPHDSHQILCLR